VSSPKTGATHRLLTRLLGRYLGAGLTPENRRKVEGKYAARSIYGSILVLALLLGLEAHQPSAFRGAALVAATVLAVLLAEAYAENLGAELDLGRRQTRQEQLARFRELAAVTVAAEAPIAFLLLGAADVIDDDTAYQLARWSTYVLLLAGGYVARRAAGKSRLSAVWSGLLVLSLGVILSGLKSWLHV